MFQFVKYHVIVNPLTILRGGKIILQNKCKVYIIAFFFIFFERYIIAFLSKLIKIIFAIKKFSHIFTYIKFM